MGQHPTDGLASAEVAAQLPLAVVVVTDLALAAVAIANVAAVAWLLTRTTEEDQP